MGVSLEERNCYNSVDKIAAFQATILPLLYEGEAAAPVGMGNA
jgi:hypothetical protein